MSTVPSPPGTQTALFRSLLKGTALYSTALFAQRIASFILLPLNTRVLNPSDYGVLELLEQIGTIVGVLLGVQITGALGYFYFSKDPSVKQDRVVSTTVLGAALIGLFAAVVGTLLANPIGWLTFGKTDYRVYLLMVFASMPFGFAMEALLSWLRVANRPSMYVAASLLRVGVTLVATLILVTGFRFHVGGVLSSSVSSICIVAIVLTVYWLRNVPFSFDWRLLIRMLRFSMPLALGSIAMFVVHFGDRFILPHYRPLAELGIYSIAYKLGMLLSLAHSSFHSYWSAQVYDVSRRDDAAQVTARVFTYMMLVLSFAGFALIVFCRPGLRILTTAQFVQAASIVPLIVLAYYIRAIGDFYRCLFLVEGRPGYDAACNWIGAIVCLSSYFLLIPRYGMWGAAISTAATFFVMAVVSMIWTYRLKPYSLEGARLMKIVIVFSSLIAAYLLVPVSLLLLQIAWGLLLTLAAVGLLWVLRFPQAEEMAQAKLLLQDGLRRLSR